jgi:flagellar biosynthetic protein FliR
VPPCLRGETTKWPWLTGLPLASGEKCATMTVFSSTYIAVFGLVLARVGGLLVAAPVFGARQVPAQSKIGLAVMLSLIFTPLQIGRAEAIPPGTVAFGILVGRELLIGLAVGFAVSLIFTGMQVGSHLVGIQMGFGLGGVLNPMSGSDSGVIDGFYTILATVIFFTANGHHAVLAAMARTFELAPVAGTQLPAVNPVQVMTLLQSVLVVALRISMPAIAALLLADVALGLVSRAAPQIHVMIEGAPVKIAVGLILLAASAPTSAMLMDAVFRNIGRSATTLIGG